MPEDKKETQRATNAEARKAALVEGHLGPDERPTPPTKVVPAQPVDTAPKVAPADNTTDSSSGSDGKA
jgi:hypothetical protein